MVLAKFMVLVLVLWLVRPYRSLILGLNHLMVVDEAKILKNILRGIVLSVL